MGTFSIWHWMIVLAVVLVLFGGGGKISRLMGDFGKGLKSFKKGLSDEGETGQDGPPDVEPPKSINSERSETAETVSKKDNAANN